ncbi:thermonuclease family protein [Uliginosibacterium sp. sgz301328]|uniref:thermonuclease family protein n=1 Tax=Uliginosibacterium sp. sgz301328 TaxID=3243764 RepID=UPI00359D33C1
MLRQFLVGLVALCSVGAIAAETFSAPVVGVSDGDTVTVLHDRQQIRVRLSEIDAPEKNQPFGQRSKQSLSELCFGVEAKIHVIGQAKKYAVTDTPRQVARVECKGIDVNAEQVRRGMAWVYDQYVTDRSFYVLQDEARYSRRGLWMDEDPVAPWMWRRDRRHSSARK